MLRIGAACRSLECEAPRVNLPCAKFWSGAASRSNSKSAIWSITSGSMRKRYFRMWAYPASVWSPPRSVSSKWYERSKSLSPSFRKSRWDRAHSSQYRVKRKSRSEISMVDLNKVVANINLDMYLPLFPLLFKEIGARACGLSPL